MAIRHTLESWARKLKRLGLYPQKRKKLTKSTSNNIQKLPKSDTKRGPWSRVQSTKHKLNDDLVRKVDQLLQKMQDLGWQPIVAEGYRTKAQQMEKVRKGYSKTMNSSHRVGKAVDIIDKRYGWAGPASKLDYKFWTDLGREAKSVGLKWGGDWSSFKDVAHVYIT